MKKNLFEMGAQWEDSWSADNRENHPTTAQPKILTPKQHRLTLAREKRRGKVVTVVHPFHLDPKTLQSLLKELKKNLGTGGAVKEDHLELQGEVASALQTALEKKGYRFK